MIASNKHLKLPIDFLHGKFNFSSSCSYDETSLFMVVPRDAEIGDVIRNMKYCWKLSIPRVALFIISQPDSKFAWKDSCNIEALVSGIIKAADAIDTWVITNGLNAGLAMEIGKGFRDEFGKRQQSELTRFESYSSTYAQVQLFRNPEVALIGLCSQTSLHYADQLIQSTEPINLHNVHYIRSNTKYDLNPNHSHFLILNDNAPSKINEFLFKMATEIATDPCYKSVEFPIGPTDSFSNRISEISVIILLLQGDLELLHYIHTHIEQKLPLVIINGSGGLADLLAFMYYEIKNIPENTFHPKYIQTVLRNIVHQKIISLFRGTDTSVIIRDKFFYKLLQCIIVGTRNGLITILNSNQSRLDKLPQHFLQAIFNCNRVSNSTKSKQIYMKQNLNLAIDWNCPLVALDEILASGIEFSSILDLQIFLKVLMKHGHEEFVDMFLKQGFQLRKFLHSDMLVFLFDYVKEDEFFRCIILEGVMGQHSSVEITHEFLNEVLSPCIATLTGLNELIRTSDLDHDFCCKGVEDEIEDEESEEKALLIVIIWAAFSFRTKLVYVLWKNSRHPIYLALFISTLLRKIENYVHEVTLKDTLRKYHIMFSKRAVHILDLYYNEFPGKAFTFIQEKHSVWCYKDVMEIAAFAENKYFLSHSCCQRYLDNVFMGKIRFRPGSKFFIVPIWLKIALTSFLFFPIYYFVSFYATVDKLTSKNIGREAQECQYPATSKFTSTAVSFTSEKPNYARDDDDPNAYLFRPVLHVKEIYPPFFKKIHYFWSAPVTRFYACIIVYFLYIALFSIVYIWPGCGNFKLDIILFFWTILILFDTILDVCRLRKYAYISTRWSVLGCIVASLFIIIFALKNLSPTNIVIEREEEFFGLILLYLYYRYSWLVTPFSPTVGPLMYRVRRMILVDFANFMRISLVILVCQAVVFQTLLYPNMKPGLSKKLLLKTFKRIFEPLFDYPGLDYFTNEHKCITFFENSSHCENGSAVFQSDCQHASIWADLLIIGFGCVFSMLMLYYLKAMFSVTHKKMRQQSEAIWKFHRYYIVMEFKGKIVPFPFSLIIYISFLKHIALNLCRIIRRHDPSSKEPIIKYMTLSHHDNMHFFKLFRAYCQSIEETEKKNEEQVYESSQTLSRRLQRFKNYSASFSTQIEYLKYSTISTNNYLLEKEKDGVKSDISYQAVNQELSRQSPYPNTPFKRYPVPNDYVSWSVKWYIYDPGLFTAPIQDFDMSIQKLFDDDLCALFENFDDENIKRHQYLWNQAVRTPAGIYINRQTWIVDISGDPISYDLDSEDLPMNPNGRTGLRGKGFLPRWGPNHCIYVLISVHCSDQEDPKNNVTGVKFLAKNAMIPHECGKISLPGGFAESHEKYHVVRNFFNSDEKQWNSPEDMISFLSSPDEVISEDTDETSGESSSSKANNNSQFNDIPHVEFHLVKRGYMDDPLNTDQAWKELELWHIHFNKMVDMELKIGSKLMWLIFSQQILNEIDKGLLKLIRKRIAV